MRNKTSSFGAVGYQPTQVYPPSLPFDFDFLSIVEEVKMLFTLISGSFTLMLFDMASEFSVSSDYNNVFFAFLAGHAARLLCSPQIFYAMLCLYLKTGDTSANA